MSTVPVPVHFDGHNINIITEDSPAMCKDRTKSLNLFRKKNNKKRKKAMRNGKLSDKKESDLQSNGGTDAKSPPPSICSVQDSHASYKSKTMKDTETTNSNDNSISMNTMTVNRHCNDAVHVEDTVLHTTSVTNECAEVASRSLDNVPCSEAAEQEVSSPSKSKGFNPNAKPFVMTPIKPKRVTNNTCIRLPREDYERPPRLQHLNPGTCHPIGNLNGNGTAGRVHAPVISDAQLIAQGFNPAEFGSHDDDGAFDEEEDQKTQPKPKDRRSLFKTELCREWSTSGWCYYNKRCSFAHGLHELRPVFRSKKWRTKRCRNWHTTGYCPYEHRCQFLHDQSPPRRMTDYAQTNARALVAAQQRMKPLYFHYQVDVERDNADAEEAVPENEGSKTQKEQSPGSSRSTSHQSSSRIQAVVPEGASMNEIANTISSIHSKGKKKKNMKNAVITQFNPSAAVYHPRPRPNPHVVNAPFALYPPTNAIPPAVAGAVPSVVPLTSMNQISSNQALLNAMNAPLPSPTNAPIHAPPQNPPSNMDSTIYLNFTPSPPRPDFLNEDEVSAASKTAGAVHTNNMVAMPQLGLQNNVPVGGHLNGYEAATSSPPPPAFSVSGKALQNMENKFETQATSIYDKVMLEINRQHVVGRQQQQLLASYGLTMPTENPLPVPSPSPSFTPMPCGLDDAALLELLPNDAFLRPGVDSQNGAYQGHGDQPKESDEELLNVNMETTEIRESAQMSATPVSGSHLENSNKAMSDSPKNAEGVSLSMNGIEPPCPPALQLHNSVDSVMMGVMNAAGLANSSPVVQASLPPQFTLAQQAHAYAHAHASAAAHFGTLNPTYSTMPQLSAAHGITNSQMPLMNGLTSPMPQMFADASALIGSQMQALRVQPPATTWSAATVSSARDEFSSGV